MKSEYLNLIKNFNKVPDIKIEDKDLRTIIQGIANDSTKKVQAKVENFLEYLVGLYRGLKGDKGKGSFLGGFANAESFQHGFLTGVLMNFRYRENLKAYVELISGMGYVDMILLVRTRARSYSAVPVIIELKKTIEDKETAKKALGEAIWYAKGLFLNNVRMLTSAKEALCVGLDMNNSLVDTREAFQIDTVGISFSDSPLLQKLLDSVWDNKDNLKKEIRKLLPPIYYLFPRTQSTYNHLSRFLMGQLPLIEKVKEKEVKSYAGYDGSDYLTVFAFSIDKQLFIFAINERGCKHEFSKLSKEKFNNLGVDVDEVSTITEINIIGYGEQQSDVHKGSPSPGRYFEKNENKVTITLYKKDEYFPSDTENNINKLTFFQIKQNDSIKSAFRDAIEYQSGAAFTEGVEELEKPGNKEKRLPMDKYEGLFKSIQSEENIFTIQGFISKEHEFKAILSGLLIGLSDLNFSTKIHVIVVPEFQVGGGARVDLAIQTVKRLQNSEGYSYSDGVPLMLELKLIECKSKTKENLEPSFWAEKKADVERNISQLSGYLKSKNVKALTDKKGVAGAVLYLVTCSNGQRLIFKNELLVDLVEHSSIPNI